MTVRIVHTQVETTLTGRQLTLARIAWIVFALTLTSLQVVSKIAAYQQIQSLTLPPDTVQALEAMGLSANFYQAFNYWLQWPIPLVWGGMALLIFWRKSNERGALVVSATMVGVGMASGIPAWQAFNIAYPGGWWIVLLGAFIGNMCLNSFFLVFPNGRYVPRWSVGLAVLLSLYNILNAYGFALPPSGLALGKSLEWLWPLFVITGVAGFILFPIYRYRRVSTPIEREQTKWVLFTISVAIALFAATVSTIFLIPGNVPGEDISFITVFVQPIGWVTFFLIIPVGIAVSILRYRLFDIDIIIRKTLQYSLLTGLLALVYFGSIVLLQKLFFGNQTSEIVIVLSTLLIAALFNPLRRRIQDFIDRRFYRKKYNATQVLADFAQTARDETELDKLTAELVHVIQETLQPEYITLWLKPTADSNKEQVKRNNPQ